MADLSQLSCSVARLNLIVKKAITILLLLLYVSLAFNTPMHNCIADFACVLNNAKSDCTCSSEKINCCKQNIFSCSDRSEANVDLILFLLKSKTDLNDQVGIDIQFRNFTRINKKSEKFPVHITPSKSSADLLALIHLLRI